MILKHSSSESFIMLCIYTINTRNEFRNVSVTEAESVTGWPLHGKQTWL